MPVTLTAIFAARRVAGLFPRSANAAREHRGRGQAHPHGNRPPTLPNTGPIRHCSTVPCAANSKEVASGGRPQCTATASGLPGQPGTSTSGADGGLTEVAHAFGLSGQAEEPVASLNQARSPARGPRNLSFNGDAQAEARWPEPPGRCYAEAEWTSWFSKGGGGSLQ